MKTNLILVLLLTLGISNTTSTAQITSSVPGFISYQGHVLDSSGIGIGTGTPVNRTVTFRVWDHPSNTLLANLLYSEEQTVTIADGSFSALVGQGVATTTPIGDPETAFGPPITSIADAFNDTQRYLGVTVDDGSAGTLDNEISPRQQIVSSAFAFRSKYAEQLGTNNVTALTALDNGRVGIGTVAPTHSLQVAGSVSARSTTATDGYVTMNAGSATVGGFLEWWNPGGNRIAYMGYHTTDLRLNLESGKNFVVTGGQTQLGLLYSGAHHINGTQASHGQGVHIEWNKDDGGGKTYILNQKGQGGGGFVFGEVDTANGITERMRLEGNGNVGIGTATPNGKLDIAGYLRVQGGEYNTGTIALGNRANAAGYYDNGIYRGALGSLAGGNILNVSSFEGVAFNTSAAAFGSQATRMYIRGADGAVGIGITDPIGTLHVHSNTDLESLVISKEGLPRWSHFSFGPNGDHYLNSGSEIGKIILQDGPGNVGIGTTTPNPDERLDVNGIIRSQGFRGRWGVNGEVNPHVFNFAWDGARLAAYIDSSFVGFVSGTSDRRLKEKIQPMKGGAIERVMALKPASFKYKNIPGTIFTGDDQTKEGFIADELQQILPSAVTGEKDAVNEDGKIQPQVISDTPIVALLTKAVQEQQQTIQKQQDEIDALKAAVKALVETAAK